MRCCCSFFSLFSCGYILPMLNTSATQVKGEEEQYKAVRVRCFIATIPDHPLLQQVWGGRAPYSVVAPELLPEPELWSAPPDSAPLLPCSCPWLAHSLFPPLPRRAMTWISAPSSPRTLPRACQSPRWWWGPWT